MLYDLKQIDGTDCYYVSRCGDVYSTARGKFKKLKPSKTHDGYLQVDIYSIGKKVKVHRLVAKAFIPNPNNYPIIDHKNNDKTDNRVENLQWCTVGFNTKKAVDDGLLDSNKFMKRGSQHPKSKKVGMYDWYTDGLIRVFGGRNEASRELGKSGINIGKTSKTVTGYYFMFI